MRKIPVAIIGAGRVGQTLGYLLEQSRRYKIRAVFSRHTSQALQAARFIGKNVRGITDPVKAASLAEIIFITTSDNVIQQVCNHIARSRGFPKRSLLIHCSGNFSSHIFSKSRTYGDVLIGSVHPLQSFARPAESIRNFRGTYCAYEGDPRALREIRRIIKALGGIPVKINRAGKPLYHAAGVIVSNYLVTLLDVGLKFFEASGFSRKQAFQAMMPLVEGTIKNIKTIGLPRALTGPVARGDVATVKSHLSLIRKRLSNYLSFYREIGKYTVAVARAKGGISKKQARELTCLFKASVRSRDKLL